MNIGRAEEAAVRTTGALFGLAAVVFSALNLSTLLDELHRAPAWWTVGSVTALAGLPALLGVLALRVRLRVLHGLALATAISALAVYTTLPLAYTGLAPAGEGPWPLQLTALGTTAGALALPSAWIAADVLAVAALTTLDRAATGGGDLGLIPLQDGLYALLFCAVFAALAAGARRTGAAVDRAAGATVAAAVKATNEQVEAAERARVNALVHDHVLTTLLVAGRAPQLTPAVAKSASTAIAELAALVTPAPSESAEVDVGAFCARLRARLYALDANAAWSARIETGSSLPARVVEAVGGAFEEAVRNAVQHAVGGGIAATVDWVEETLVVAVRDSGPGFDLSQLPPSRLGVRRSIEERMHRAGGDAQVETRRGAGTTVRLRWPR